MKTYRVGILGCRARGTAAARAYATHPRTEVVALCDLQPELTDALGDELGVAARYTDLDRMMHETEPDLVAVPTGTEFHYPLCMQVLEYAVHIDVEKPLCTELEQADALLARAREKGVLVSVHHQSRVGASMRAVREAIAAGKIGEIRHVDACCKGYYAGYGMMNIGTHMLNNFMALLGPCRAASATAMTGGRRATVEDVVVAPGGMGIVLGERVTATLEFDRGVTATALFHRFDKVDSQAYHFEVLGSEGRLFWKSGGAWWLPTPHFVPDGERGRWQPLLLSRPEGFDPGGKADADEFAYVEEYVRALDEGRPHECSGEAARHALEINMGIFESAARGCRVTLPQEQREHPLRRWRAEAGLGDPQPGPRPYQEWVEWELARQASRLD